jgi:hypothetical protein
MVSSRRLSLRAPRSNRLWTDPERICTARFGAIASLRLQGQTRKLYHLTALASGVKLGDYLPQVITVEVGIDFGGCDGDVAQHFLHRA